MPAGASAPAAAAERDGAQLSPGGRRLRCSPLSLLPSWASCAWAPVCVGADEGQVLSCASSNKTWASLRASPCGARRGWAGRGADAVPRSKQTRQARASRCHFWVLRGAAAGALVLLWLSWALLRCGCAGAWPRPGAWDAVGVRSLPRCLLLPFAPPLGLAPAFCCGLQSPWYAGRSRGAASDRTRALLHPPKCHIGEAAAGDAVRVIWWTSVARVPLSTETRHHVAAASRWKLSPSLI